MKIAFQGEPGAYSEAAIISSAQDQEVNTLPRNTFQQVFDYVTNSYADYGLVPIENSLAGSIYQVYDLLLRNELWVIGEYYLRVSHCLISKPGSKIENIQKVISHPQALRQCEGFLQKLPGVEIEPVYDTAGSVKMVREMDDPNVAAIASQRAADIYEMGVLKSSIEDNPANYTRFLAISRSQVIPRDASKTSIVFTMANLPGALFKAMSAFALRDIDLTKLESRPLVGKPWEYLFYLDLAGSVQDEVVSRALSHLNEFATMLRVFGSYPRNDPKNSQKLEYPAI